MTVLLDQATREGLRVLFAAEEEGRWVTMDGAHVHIDDGGTIDKGPKGMTGKTIKEAAGAEAHGHGSSGKSHAQPKDGDAVHSHKGGTDSHEHPATESKAGDALDAGSQALLNRFLKMDPAVKPQEILASAKLLRAADSTLTQQQSLGHAISNHIAAKPKPAAPVAEPKQAPPPTEHFEHVDGVVSSYPTAGEKVSGLVVRKDTPNLSSIDASLSGTDYRVLPGVREVSMKHFSGVGGKGGYEVGDMRRNQELAKQIKKSGEINPLIVGIDKEGPYIIEGGHRIEALHALGKKTFPAVVVAEEDATSAKSARGRKAEHAVGRGRLMNPLRALFAKLDTAEREKLADKGEAEPNGSYPIRNRADLENAVKAWGRGGAKESDKRWIMKRARELNATDALPDDWQDDGDKDDAADHARAMLGDLDGAAVFSADDNLVYRSGMIFRAGEYPEADYTMDADEIESAAAAFDGPVPIDLGHGTKSHHPLEGKFGQVVHVEARGHDLYATTALPRWLNDAIGQAKIKVSASFDRATKTLRGLALVTDPIVPEAALFGAYADFAAKHQTSHGLRALQDVHDACVRGGAVCKRPADMASAGEHNALQGAHDLVADRGARCEGIAPGTLYPLFGKPTDGLEATHPRESARKENADMSLLDKILMRGLQDLATDDGDAEDADVAAPKPRRAAPVADLGATADLSRELAEQRARADRAEAAKLTLEVKTIGESAANFAEKIIGDGRAVPNQRDHIKRAHAQAAIDDLHHGRVNLGEGQTTTRVDLLEATFAAGLSDLVSEVELASVVHEALMNRQKTGLAAAEGDVITAQEHERLLRLTPMGAGIADAMFAKNGSH